MVESKARSDSFDLPGGDYSDQDDDLDLLDTQKSHELLHDSNVYLNLEQSTSV